MRVAMLHRGTVIVFAFNYTIACARVPNGRLRIGANHSAVPKSIMAHHHRCLRMTFLVQSSSKLQGRTLASEGNMLTWGDKVLLQLSIIVRLIHARL